MVADIPVPGPVIGNGELCKQRVWVAIAVILGASVFEGGQRPVWSLSLLTPLLLFEAAMEKAVCFDVRGWWSCGCAVLCCAHHLVTVHISTG